MDGFVDSATLVDMYRVYPLAVAWMQARSHLTLGVTPIAWMEMMAGAKNKVDQAQVIQFLKRFPIVYLTQVDMDWAMQQLQTYQLSHQVGVLDCLIASAAHRLQLPLYTRNLKHFAPLLGALAIQPY